MPRPMTPTVLTVLTRASTSAFSRSPVVISIIGPLIVPPRHDPHRGSMRMRTEQRVYAGLYARRVNRDSDADFPGTKAVNEELRLLPSLPVVVIFRVSPALGTDNLPVDLIQALR